MVHILGSLGSEALHSEEHHTEGRRTVGLHIRVEVRRIAPEAVQAVPLHIPGLAGVRRRIAYSLPVVGGKGCVGGDNGLLEGDIVLPEGDIVQPEGYIVLPEGDIVLPEEDSDLLEEGAVLVGASSGPEVDIVGEEVDRTGPDSLAGYRGKTLALLGPYQGLGQE